MPYQTIIDRHLLGTITREESIELEAVLKASREAREIFRQSCNIDAALRHEAANPETSTSPATDKIKQVWFSSRLTSAAAGLIFGVFCTSMAWAVVGPYTYRAVALLQESFESGPAPLTSGLPVTVGQWSGDYTEVAGEQKGVNPASGVKMLRFLRGDYVGKPNPDGSYISDLYQLIDIRPYRQEIRDRDSLVHLSAKLNMTSFPMEERYDCSLGIYALSAEMVADGTAHNDIELANGSLAMSREWLPNLDHDPATWQKVESELRLPSNTDFLLIHIEMLHGGADRREITFAAHYLDDVRLTLMRRPPMP
ncbi:hypothetical protein BH11VER1_BH11VER1_10390 [soil metagenome]